MEGRAPVIKKSGKTIDPARIVSVKDWINAYKQRYVNLVLSDDGAFLVLDPTQVKKDYATALAAPVKTVPHIYASDFINVLRAADSEEGLRAAAESSYAAFRSEIDARTSSATEAFTAAEADLLIAADNWKGVSDPVSRKQIALRVGEALQKTAAADRALREAQYPHRYIYTYNELARRMLRPETFDDRTAEPVYALVPNTSVPRDRVVILGGGGVGAAVAAEEANENEE
jgi:hypothetical protein